MGKAYITIAAMLIIGALTGIALMKGINGAVLMSGIGAVAALGGFVLGKVKK